MGRSKHHTFDDFIEYMKLNPHLIHSPISVDTLIGIRKYLTSSMRDRGITRLDLPNNGTLKKWIYNLRDNVDTEIQENPYNENVDSVNSISHEAIHIDRLSSEIHRGITLMDKKIESLKKKIEDNNQKLEKITNEISETNQALHSEIAAAALRRSGLFHMGMISNLSKAISDFDIEDDILDNTNIIQHYRDNLMIIDRILRSKKYDTNSEEYRNLIATAQQLSDIINQHK